MPRARASSSSRSASATASTTAGRAVGRRAAARRDRARADPASRGCCSATSRPAISIARPRNNVALAAARPAPAAAHHPDRRHPQRAARRDGSRSGSSSSSTRRLARSGPMTRMRRVTGSTRLRPSPLLAHQPRGGRSGWRPRWRCWPARCWSATRCAAACAISCCSASAAPIGRRVERILPGGARRRPAGRRRFRRVVRRRLSDRRGPGRRDRPGERAARVARAGLRRGRSVLAVSRVSEHRTGPDGRGAFVSTALAAEIGATAGAHVVWSASSGRRRFRSSRCTAARTSRAARCG